MKPKRDPLEERIEYACHRMAERPETRYADLPDDYIAQQLAMMAMPMPINQCQELIIEAAKRLRKSPWVEGG